MRIKRAVQLTAALVTTVTLASNTAHAALTAIVPAYFYPSGGGLNSDWADLNAAAARIPLTAIMNPGSGPGTFKDNNYVNAVNNLRAAGGKVIAYVYTSYGSRSSTLVKADIDKYADWYNLDGIFFDEFSNSGSTGTLNYYQDLYDYVKAINPVWEVMGNPGTNTVEPYLTRPAADSLLVFENEGANYPGYTPSSWNFNYDASRIGHLVHTAPTEADMLDYLDLAVQRNAGQVYITDDVMNNPWDRLPIYWESQVTRIEAINNTEPPPLPGGQTMSNPIANGAIVVTSADRSDWAAIPAYNPDGADTGGEGADYQQVQVAHDDDNFYFRTLLNTSVPLDFHHNIFIDTDFDRDTGFVGGGNQLAVGAEYLLQGSSVYAFNGPTPTSWGWTFLGTQPVNSSPDTDIETLIPRSLIGNPDGFDLTVFGDNATNDDYYPNLGQDPLRYLVELLVGDLDGDGFVGISDLNIVLGNWNQAVAAGSTPDGDPSGDGFVGIEDLNLVLGNWNAGTPPATDSSIPEPATLFVVLLGAIGLTRRH